MADLSPSQRRRLEEMGREQISLPAEIYFGGNVEKQKQAGTDKHPNIIKYRLRVAMDRLERARADKMSDTERRNAAGGLEGAAMIKRLENDVVGIQEELAESLGFKIQKEISDLKIEEKKPSEVLPATTTGTATTQVDVPLVVPMTKKKSPGRPKKAAVAPGGDDLSSD